MRQLTSLRTYIKKDFSTYLPLSSYLLFHLRSSSFSLYTPDHIALSCFQNGSTSNDADVQLDEEITKVFTMDPGPNADTFDVSKLHDSADMSEPRKYGEQEYFRECLN